MISKSFGEGWRFAYTPTEAWTQRVPGVAQRPVTLPHDFKLELTRTADCPSGSSEAHYPGGVGYYEKTFMADARMCGGRAMLLLDGAYRITHVRINRELVAVHTGGYTAFLADMTGKLKVGENTLLVTVDASLMPASRWYTGAGLYRDVTLLTGGQVCFAPMETRIQTEIAQGSAIVRVVAPVLGQGEDAPSMHAQVLAPNGQVVATWEGGAGEEMAIALDAPILWSPESPALYTLSLALRNGTDPLDSQAIPFGIRTVSVSAREGLTLNGRPLLLKGGCVHHDNGVLGARSHPDAEWRKVQRLKECGYNAIRCAHNPPSTAFLDACDRQGMLVIDEAFDCWREGKKQLDDHIFFETQWQQTLRSMILRDRNHPSVIMWSTGNEIVERSGISDGADWSRRLADYVRALDSTRPVNNAVCGFFEDPEIAEMAANSLSTAGEGKDFWAQRSEAFLAPLDVAGYNYLLDRYEKDHALYPERIMLGTESFPAQALDNWQAVQMHPYLLGDFVWTAWDYLGESGIGHTSFDGPTSGHKPFPYHLATCGDLDICGIKRPQSHYRDFVWSGRVTPYIATQHPRHFGSEEHLMAWGWPDIAECWNYAGHEGKPVLVTVYAAGDEVELLLEGISLGRRPAGEAHRYTATFEVPYKPGRLEAIAYACGKRIGHAQLETTGHPSALRMIAETQPDAVSMNGLLYVQVEVSDEAGRLVPDACPALEAGVDGAAELYAFGCADPEGAQQYTGTRCRAYKGRALAVLRRTGDGPVALTVTSPGLVHSVLNI